MLSELRCAVNCRGATEPAAVASVAFSSHAHERRPFKRSPSHQGILILTADRGVMNVRMETTAKTATGTVMVVVTMVAAVAVAAAAVGGLSKPRRRSCRACREGSVVL